MRIFPFQKPFKAKRFWPTATINVSPYNNIAWAMSQKSLVQIMRKVS